MHTAMAMEERLAEIARRIDRLHQSTHGGAPEVTTRIDIAEQSAAAETAEDHGTFVAAVEAELHAWDAYLERLQVKAATTAESARDQAEAAISELRRRRNALGERLGQVRAARAATETSDRTSVDAARDELERMAAAVAAQMAGRWQQRVRGCDPTLEK